MSVVNGESSRCSRECQQNGDERRHRARLDCVPPAKGEPQRTRRGARPAQQENTMVRAIVRSGRVRSLTVRMAAAGMLVTLLPTSSLAQGERPFRLQEATIDEIHAAIQRGEITCQGLVQAYLNRAKAYDGMCTALVTRDGKPIPPALGAVRAG